MADLLEVTLDEMAREAVREVALRRKAYPRFVNTGRLKQDKADRQIEVMEKIADYLREQADLNRKG